MSDAIGCVVVMYVHPPSLCKVRILCGIGYQLFQKRLRLINIAYIACDIERGRVYFADISFVSKPMSQTFPGYSPPPIKQKSSYQRGSKREQVPRYSLLCRNPRNAVINKKHATMSNS